MQHFISTAGIAGFAIVYGLNLVNGNDPGKAVVSALLAALGFAVLTRSFMRKTFVQLHHSAFEQQQAATEAVPAETEVPPAETEAPPAEIEAPPAETEAVPAA
ncbi:MAG: hypothetical protein QF685_00125 [Verrucomicrobiota bacterium]|nr:hypothetical protein [Verrucomicrobiota bacterium]